MTSTPPSLPKRLVGVSLKMYFDLDQTSSYIKSIASSTPTHHHTCSIFIIPSFPTLTTASTLLRPTPHILLGAQNCHWEDSGPYTGEVSPKMLSQIGCTIVELGHAERRRGPFNETDEITAMKAQAVVRNGMIPLVCIGEKARSSIVSEGVGIAVRECSPQITAVLRAVPKDSPIIFAYEPVWAIGATEPASADHVVAVVKSLKEIVGTWKEVRIIYGGSAGPGTWGSLKEGVDGLFLGRFGHKVEDFMEAVREVRES